jgi:hypothetical protein
MLRQVVEHCPESLWDATEGKSKFWHIAYHALFYADLYLSDSLDTFKTHPMHRADAENLGKVSQPYAKDEIFQYLNYCREKVATQTANTDFSAESGFHWLPFNKLELQFYNIRHIQHHMGQLQERLAAHGISGAGWVGMKRE